MPETAIEIRRATLADLDTVAPLFDAYRQFYRRNGDLALAQSFLRERMERGESVIFVGFLSCEAVGFTQLYPSFSSASAARIYILNDLFVAPESRRMGVGERLLEAAVDFARGNGAIAMRLSTEITNAAAQSLYERAGWARDMVFLHYNLAL